MSDESAAAPKRNASAAEWLTYAETQPQPAALEGRALTDLTRDQLRELFSPDADSARLPTSEDVSAGYRPPPSPSVVARPVDIAASLAAHTDAPTSPAVLPIPYSS